MVAYVADDYFFGVLEAIDFLVFFDFCDTADNTSISMGYGMNNLDYGDLNLKIRHF